MDDELNDELDELTGDEALADDSGAEGAGNEGGGADAGADDKSGKDDKAEDERFSRAVAAGVEQALERLGIKPQAPANKPADADEDHPGFTPKEIRDNSVRMSITEMNAYNDAIDSAMESIDETFGDEISRDEKKAIKQQLRGLDPKQLKQAVGQGGHLLLAKSMWADKEIKRRQSKQRNGGGEVPVGSRGSAPRGDAKTATLSRFERDFGKLRSPGQKDRLRKAGVI